jgi:hypothetical protein
MGASSEHCSERRKQESDAAIRGHIEEQGRIIKHLENEVHAQKEIAEQATSLLSGVKQTKAWQTLRKLKNLPKNRN